ncbi:MAG: hypothetical protein JRD89_10875 [Deltaproteobacteria bacterium]|nr:hypothetical protein [Deltaproteobacteria bacterium]
MWKKLAYKVAQAFGISATVCIALGLSFGWLYEPRLWVKLVEIIGSLIAAVILFMDALDIHPQAD